MLQTQMSATTSNLKIQLKASNFDCEVEITVWSTTRRHKDDVEEKLHAFLISKSDKDELLASYSRPIKRRGWVPKNPFGFCTERNIMSCRKSNLGFPV
jgi:hypothetical protein